MRREDQEENGVEAEIVRENVQDEAQAPVKKKKKKKKKPVESFALHWSNGVLFGIFSLILIVLFVIYSEKTPQKIGMVTGSIVALVLWPAILSFILWLLTKSKMAVTISFNVLIILVFLGNLAMRLPNREQIAALRQMEQEKEALKKILSSTDDPEKTKAALDKYNENVQKSLGKMAQSSSGNEKQALEILKTFSAETEKATAKWRTTFDALGNPRILDYSQLKNPGEFDYQKNIAKTYIAETRIYVKYLQGMTATLTQRLSVVGLNDPFIKGVLDGATKKQQSQKAILDPLMNQHLALGNTFLEILDILEKKQSVWSANGGQLEINDPDTLRKVNTLVENIDKIKVKIDQYANELTKTL